MLRFSRHAGKRVHPLLCLSSASFPVLNARRSIANEVNNGINNTNMNNKDKNDDNKIIQSPVNNNTPPPMFNSDNNNTNFSPVDFNPHIEWFEYPKEIFDPKYPFTREEGIRMTEEAWDSTMDEMASRYGMRLNPSTKVYFVIGYFISAWYGWYTLWGSYRAMGLEPGYHHFLDIALQKAAAPEIEEDDIYLDWWVRPEYRERSSRFDIFWNWKPPTKRDGAKTSWALPNPQHDPSEWIHMTSRD